MVNPPASPPSIPPRRLQRLTELLHEVGMLRHTPRSGYQFLGTGAENVAEHSHRTAIIGYVLAKLAGADPAKTALIGLFHDLGEARTGDLNHVNQRYGRLRERDALHDALAETGLEAEIVELYDAHANGKEAQASLEGRLACDADQLDLLLNLKREYDLGNRYANAWMEAVCKRLQTPEARELANTIMNADHTNWWMAL